MSDQMAMMSLKLDRLLADQAEQGRQMTESAAAMTLLHQALRGPEGGHALLDLLERIRALLAQQGGDLSLIQIALERQVATMPGAAINGGRPAARTGAGPAEHG